MVQPLRHLCQDVIISILERNAYHPRMINDLCKRIPHPLLERVFEALIERNVITDVALLAFLVPERTWLNMRRAIQIRNATFKQISLNCPKLLFLDLSDCVQVSNAVVTCILQGCPLLNELRLDRCHRITDAAFDSTQSLFHPLIGCLSLEAISLQGCPQLTGEVVETLNKLCMKLQYLNLSQCKRIETSAIQRIFEHHRIISLNLSFIDSVSDEAFFLNSYSSHPALPTSLTSTNTSVPLNITSSSLMMNNLSTSPLQKLFLGKSTITDTSIYHMTFLGQLREIGLQWCSGLTDEGIITLTLLCPKLQIIDLKSCSITDVSIEAIVKNCVSLKHLDVSWCMGVTDRAFIVIANHTIATHLKLGLPLTRRISSPIHNMTTAIITNTTTMATTATTNTMNNNYISFNSTTGNNRLRSSSNASISTTSSTYSTSYTTLHDYNVYEPESNITHTPLIHSTSSVNNTTSSAMTTYASSYPVHPSTTTNITTNVNNIIPGLCSLNIVWCSQLTDTTINALLQIPSLIEVDISGCTGISEHRIQDLIYHGIHVKSDS